jgi:selenocysteine lyase/cysteine desulfurase
VGVLYGKYDLLDRLTAYRVRPAPQDPPGKFETGTGNFEGICGVLGALEYIEWVGQSFGEEHRERFTGEFTGRRLCLKLGMSAIRSYEFELSQALLDILAETPGVTVYGITDAKRLEERVPTCAFTLKGKSPRQVAEELDEANIYVWDGNYYALVVTERLGLEESGGMVRVGPVHYNTLDEIEKFGLVMRKIAVDKRKL